jgi:hypothetical protein
MPKPHPQYAIFTPSGEIVAIKAAISSSVAAENYPGCTAKPFDGTVPESLKFCPDCGSRDTIAWSRGFRSCNSCASTYSLSVWRDRPDFEHPSPELTQSEKAQFYSRQKASQRQIAALLQISAASVNKILRK